MWSDAMVEAFNGELSSSFDRYASSFRVQGELPYLLDLKLRHSYRVREEAMSIARHSDQVPPHQHPLAFAVGLLHDLGRFQQYRLHGTFNDSASVDHGDLGARILESDLSHLSALMPQRWWHLLKLSIGLHNKRRVPQGLDPDEELWVRLARDADRLDVYRVITGHLERGTMIKIIPRLVDQDSPPSDLIVEEILTTHTADYSMVRSLADLLLVQISWAYDMSFPWSMAEVLRRGVVERISRFVPKTSGAKRVIQDVKAWLVSSTRSPAVQAGV